MLRALLILGLVAVVPIWSVATGASQGAKTVAAREAAIVREQQEMPTQIDRVAQADQSDDDTSMEVILWTVLAAGIAAGVGLVLYMVRVILGRVRIPPPQEDTHH
jgi:hypothetical protein